MFCLLLLCASQQSAQAAGGPSCRPLVFALSNPTDQAEVTFEDALRWTAGAAVYASGSPFAAVTNTAGRVLRPAQANNCFVFPGLAQGILDGGIRHVDDRLLLVAAEALASGSAIRNGLGLGLREWTYIQARHLFDRGNSCRAGLTGAVGGGLMSASRRTATAARFSWHRRALHHVLLPDCQAATCPVHSLH